MAKLSEKDILVLDKIFELYKTCKIIIDEEKYRFETTPHRMFSIFWVGKFGPKRWYSFDKDLSKKNLRKRRKVQRGHLIGDPYGGFTKLSIKIAEKYQRYFYVHDQDWFTKPDMIRGIVGQIEVEWAKETLCRYKFSPYSLGEVAKRIKLYNLLEETEHFYTGTFSSKFIETVSGIKGEIITTLTNAIKEFRGRTAREKCRDIKSIALYNSEVIGYCISSSEIVNDHSEGRYNKLLKYTFGASDNLTKTLMTKLAGKYDDITVDNIGQICVWKDKDNPGAIKDQIILWMKSCVTELDKYIHQYLFVSDVGLGAGYTNVKSKQLRTISTTLTNNYGTLKTTVNTRRINPTNSQELTSPFFLEDTQFDATNIKGLLEAMGGNLMPDSGRFKNKFRGSSVGHSGLKNRGRYDQNTLKGLIYLNCGYLTFRVISIMTEGLIDFLQAYGDQGFLKNPELKSAIENNFTTLYSKLLRFNLGQHLKNTINKLTPYTSTVGLQSAKKVLCGDVNGDGGIQLLLNSVKQLSKVKEEVETDQVKYGNIDDFMNKYGSEFSALNENSNLADLIRMKGQEFDFTLILGATAAAGYGIYKLLKVLKPF
ncbi:MAG: hypothetical protein GY756_01480 [bacterium]|nr:hypothetical protein [bacterium]